MKKLLAAALFAWPCAAAAQTAAADPLLAALKTELARSVAGLKNAEPAPLYYLGYEAYDRTNYSLSARLGSLSNEDYRRSRQLDVDARAGSAALDNTHEFKGGNSSGNSKQQRYFSLPVEDDAAPLRAEIWSLTDQAYKTAQDQYAKVQMNKSVTAEEEDKSADFSSAPVAGFYEKAVFPDIDKARFRAMARRLSEKFKPYDFIYNSEVSLMAETVNRYMVNSEGAGIVTGNTYVRFIYSLYTRTPDGMDLSRVKIYDSDTPGEIPGEAVIGKDIDASISELKALRDAPPEQPYSGPVLLESRAAGVFFHEILGHRLEGHRQKSEDSGQTFAKKVGQPIMPSFLSVFDDPSQYRYGSQFLRGFYRYDDETVPAQKAELITGGVLKGFLMNRSPIRNFPVSNGHGRRSDGRGPVARMGNLIVVSTKTVPYPELRAALIGEVKKAGRPYGLVVTDISGGFTITDRYLPQSFSVNVTLGYKVYADGRPDEAVRGLNLIGTPLQTFSRIVLTGDDYGVFNGTCGAESGWVPVSAVAPSLLFSEMETEKVQKANDKPPVLKPPFTDKGL
ncbi:MAG TPA: metallopeptidase TldD-related protein [Elusimicrobiales bacterium]|nr:metallopeptidase TldD-related protein [Elusimicrobiales bacterium]